MAGVVVRARFPRRHVVLAVATNLARYMFAGAARNWARNAGSTAPALVSMTVLLVMLGLVGLTGFTLYNLEQFEASQASLLHIYIRDDASGDQEFALESRLRSDPRIDSVVYVSKDAALARARRMPGLPEFAGATDSNPFPASIDVHVRSIADVAAIDAMVRYDSVVDPVTPTSYDQGAYQRIQAVLFWLAVAGVAFVGMLAFVAVAVTMNSIKAAINARRDEIAIMQLVGAPRWMVRGPFVVEGAITGALAGAVAGLVTVGLATAAVASAANGFMQFAPGLTLTVAEIAGAIVLVTGAGLGSGCSVLSLRRHMES
ncbi:MAG TPA: permease-like cell division protein FtsX [Candidatus Dormibacteraeota bacterium]|nr:permease-like cell division protein FtsX [Candidatus Dormibacteraeota bacterium]